MKESRRKGVANHPDSESCVASRKTGREALTGAHVRLDIELRNKWIRSADVVHRDGRTAGGREVNSHPYRDCGRGGRATVPLCRLAHYVQLPNMTRVAATEMWSPD
jgi:hypothetical protein